MVAEGLFDAIDAAAWSVSFVPHDGVALQTVRGIESRLEPRLEQRELRLASDDPYALKEFPLTRWALQRRQGFLALRDASDHDPAERSVLETLDYLWRQSRFRRSPGLSVDELPPRTLPPQCDRHRGGEAVVVRGESWSIRTRQGSNRSQE